MVVFKWEWNAKRPGHADGVIDTIVLDIIRQEEEEEGEKKKRSSYYFTTKIIGLASISW